MNLDLNRVHAKLQKKISKSVGHRVDLVLADTRKIDAENAHFMLEYNNNVPNTDDISEFFVRQYNAKLIPDLTTARVHPEHKVVTVVASILNVTRDLSDSKKMTPVIAGCTYLDTSLNEIWEVREASNNEKVLARKVKDDIKGIVNARKNLMLDPKSNKTFASVDVASSLLNLSMIEEGDIVKAYSKGKLHEDLIVNQVDENELSVTTADMLSLSLPKEAVIEVKKKNKASDKKNQKRVTDYFADAYGDKKYAKKLTKGMPNK